MEDNQGEMGIETTAALGTVLLFFWAIGAPMIYDYLSRAKYDTKYLKDEEVIDSTYDAKRNSLDITDYEGRDSLSHWYFAKIDSLDKDYQTRKNLEGSAK